MPTWYEKAEDQIEREYENGVIDSKEYQQQMRDLRMEMEAEAEEAARHTYDNYMGRW